MVALGGACVAAPRGACMVARGGVCVVALGGCGCCQGVRCCSGGCVVALGGHAWLLQGGHVWDTTRYGDTINERAVHILLECILVRNFFKK